MTKLFTLSFCYRRSRRLLDQERVGASPQRWVEAGRAGVHPDSSPSVRHILVAPAHNAVAPDQRSVVFSRVPGTLLGNEVGLDHRARLPEKDRSLGASVQQPDRYQNAGGDRGWRHLP